MADVITFNSPKAIEDSNDYTPKELLNDLIEDADNIKSVLVIHETSTGSVEIAFSNLNVPQLSMMSKMIDFEISQLIMASQYISEE